MSKKNETNLAKVIKDLKMQIEELTLQLERGGGASGTTDIQRVLAELEFAKLQNWEEKRKLSQRYEANRHSLLSFFFFFFKFFKFFILWFCSFYVYCC